MEPHNGRIGVHSGASAAGAEGPIRFEPASSGSVYLPLWARLRRCVDDTAYRDYDVK
jgi:hypothetical protein